MSTQIISAEIQCLYLLFFVALFMAPITYTIHSLPFIYHQLVLQEANHELPPSYNSF